LARVRARRLAADNPVHALLAFRNGAFHLAVPITLDTVAGNTINH
jgi:hypothetical protein